MIRVLLWFAAVFIGFLLYVGLEIRVAARQGARDRDFDDAVRDIDLKYFFQVLALIVEAACAVEKLSDEERLKATAYYASGEWYEEFRKLSESRTKAHRG